MSRVLFSWLHVSDIHANHGSVEHWANQQAILRALKADISNAVQNFGAPRPRAILVTGDIAFSGNVCKREKESVSSEYVRARDWLLDVAGLCKISPGLLFFVPGNHDVSRTTKGLARDSLLALRRGEREIDEALSDEDYQAMLSHRLHGYLDFCRDLNVGCAALSSWQHVIPAEEGLRIRLVGLNTALLCNDEKDKGQLFLGQAQVNALTDHPPSDNELVLRP